MTQLPDTLEDAIAQAREATQAAIAAGYSRLQVELLLPELKPMPAAFQFIPVFADQNEHLNVYFTDTGAAALAKRDWGKVPYKILSIDIAGTRQTTPVEELIEPEDRVFVFVAPSAVEISPVEKICNAAGDRPTVLFNPRLEDVGTVGIGYAARHARNRFLVTFEPCYYLKPLEGIILFRCYPSPWQVWLESTDGNYQMVAEEPQKPDLERIEAILMAASGANRPAKRGFLAELDRLLKALTQ